MKQDTVQMKVSGLMCSFCTMSVEKAPRATPAATPCSSISRCHDEYRNDC